MLDMAGFAEAGAPVLTDPGTRRWDQFMDLRAAGGTKISFSRAGKAAVTSAPDAQDSLRVNEATGLPVVQLGSYSASYGSVWLGNVTPAANGTNYALIGNGTSQLFLNTPSGGTMYFRINHASQSGMGLSATGLGIGIEAPTARLHVIDNAAGTVAAKIQGAASQTANLTNWENSGATVLSSVDKDGYHILPGGLRLLGYVSSAAAPTTTELPTSKDCAIHKDTNLGTLRIAFNDGGTIRSVVLA
jgi:hypothetical protein